MKFNKRAILIPIGIFVLIYVFFADCSDLGVTSPNDGATLDSTAIDTLLSGLVCTSKLLYYGTLFFGIFIIIIAIYSIIKNGLFKE